MNLEIKDFQEGKLIILSKALDSRTKVLNVIYFLVFSSLPPLLFITLTNNRSQSIGATLFFLVFFGFYFLIAYRFINKAFQSEKLYIHDNKLTIIKSSFISRKENTYDFNQISNFRHLDKPEISKHPLTGDTIDYFGFQTNANLANELHGDERLAFEYNGKTIKFGENIYSWDFEQLKDSMDLILGNTF